MPTLPCKFLHWHFDTLALSFKMSIIPYIFRSITYILILVNAYIAFKKTESVKSAKSVMSFFYKPVILYMGSPQILICGESGGNGRTYDLAERYRPLRSICRTRSLYIPYIFLIHSLFINLTKCLSNP